MKPDTHDALDDPTRRWLAELKPPEIVGEFANPVLEAVRRFWWRTFDSLRGCFLSLRLSLFDRIHGPEPLTRKARPYKRSYKLP